MVFIGSLRYRQPAMLTLAILAAAAICALSTRKLGARLGSSPATPELMPLRSFVIFTRLINGCWSMFQWGLFLTVTAALLVGGYFYLRFDDEIRRHVQQMLASHYPNLTVKVGKARFEKGRGILVYDLAISDPKAAGPPQPILAIDELFLACDTRVEELLSGKPRMDRIDVRRPRLHAVRQADGSWNLLSLLPLPRLSEEAPQLVIEDATLVVEDAGAARCGAADVARHRHQSNANDRGRWRGAATWKACSYGGTRGVAAGGTWRSAVSCCRHGGRQPSARVEVQWHDQCRSIDGRLDAGRARTGSIARAVGGDSRQFAGEVFGGSALRQGGRDASCVAIRTGRGRCRLVGRCDVEPRSRGVCGVAPSGDRFVDQPAGEQSAAFDQADDGQIWSGRRGAGGGAYGLVARMRRWRCTAKSLG